MYTPNTPLNTLNTPHIHPIYAYIHQVVAGGFASPIPGGRVARHEGEALGGRLALHPYRSTPVSLYTLTSYRSRSPSLIPGSQ